MVHLVRIQICNRSWIIHMWMSIDSSDFSCPIMKKVKRNRLQLLWSYQATIICMRTLSECTMYLRAHSDKAFTSRIVHTALRFTSEFMWYKKPGHNHDHRRRRGFQRRPVFRTNDQSMSSVQLLFFLDADILFLRNRSYCHHQQDWQRRTRFLSTKNNGYYWYTLN